MQRIGATSTAGGASASGACTLTHRPHRVTRIVKEPARPSGTRQPEAKKKPRAVQTNRGFLEPGRKAMRAFRPQIERLRDRISCFRQSEAAIDKPINVASIKDGSRVRDERMSAMLPFRYRFACKQNLVMHIHRGAQSTLAYVDCQRRFNKQCVQRVRALARGRGARRKASLQSRLFN